MKEKIKKTFKVIFLVVIVMTMAMYWFDQYGYYFGEYYKYTFECPFESNVALIKIQGEIVTYGTELVDSVSEETISTDIVSSETIVGYLNKIEEDDNMEAIIVEIDSYGGYPVASEEIMNAIKKMTKPTVAVIREGAVSGAYLIASAADRIYASEMSDIGGIGVTMSYLDYSQKHKKEGIVYQEISSAEFKDMAHPDRELTEQEKEILRERLKKLHDILVRKISENRNLEIEAVERLADGNIMIAKDAEEKGLIDEIGDIYTVQEWIKYNLNIEPKICIYR